MRPIEVTVLMPCLNEGRTVGACVQTAIGWLERCGVDGEVLVAENGSTDDSSAVAAAAGARVIDVIEQGYGTAIRAGIIEARGRFVIFGDSDGSYDFAALMPFLLELRSGADLVVGNRFLGGIAPGAMPRLHRSVGVPALSWLGRVRSDTRVGDFHCGLRGVRREAALGWSLRSGGMEFATELVLAAARCGAVISEVPATLVADAPDRHPHLRPWRDGLRHLGVMIRRPPPASAVSPVTVVSPTSVATGDSRVVKSATEPG